MKLNKRSIRQAYHQRQGVWETTNYIGKFKSMTYFERFLNIKTTDSNPDSNCFSNGLDKGKSSLVFFWDAL